MAGTVMPAPKFVGLDNNANPVSGGKLYTYVAGTTTPQPTYSDVNLTVANANPVILDSAGRATVFLSGSSYKFVLTDADDVTIWTQDNVQAVAPFSTNLDILGVAGEAILAGQACYLSDGSGALTAGRWYLADSDNAYSSSLPQIAIAPDAVGSGESGTFRLQGSVTKSNAQADFVVGDVYYVAATPGQLSATPGTNVRVMGQADSTTTLVISPNPPNIADTPTFIDGITVTSTDAGAAAAPYLDLYRESASPAASDQIGEIRFTGEDSAGNKQLYGRVYGQIADPTSTSEDGQVRISTMKAGTETIALVIDETGQILPDAANQALGSATKQWADLFLENGGVVNFNNSDTLLTHAAGKLTLAGSGAGTLEVKGAILPTVSNTPALGSTSLQWADVFLGSGAVVNFDNGDVTVTHSTNTLTFAGASSGYVFNDGILTVSTAGLHTFSGASAAAGGNRLRVENTTATGYAQFSGIAGTSSGSLEVYGQSFSTSGAAVASGTALFGESSGGLSIAATHASGAIRFYSGGSTLRAGVSASGSLWAGTDPGSAYTTGDVVASRSSTTGIVGLGTDGTVYLYRSASATTSLVGTDLSIAATKKLYLDGGGDTYINENASNTVRIWAGGAASMDFYSTGVGLQPTSKLFLDGGSDTYLIESAANEVSIYVGGNQELRLDTGTLLVPNVYSDTTGSAANVFVDTNGRISRSTSSLRYKHAVETLDTADAHAAVMAMRPVTYRGTTDADQRRFVGFIAEEMQQIAPLLCTYDEGGESGTPNYVTYDRVTAYLVAVVQQQQTEIDALKARLN